MAIGTARLLAECPEVLLHYYTTLHYYATLLTNAETAYLLHYTTVYTILLYY